MNIDKILKHHFSDRKYARITRKISKNKTEISRGYIRDWNEKFVLIQESDNFRILGLNLIEKSSIIEIRYNENDDYYDKIMDWEGEKKKLDSRITVELKLNSWKSVFESIKRSKKTVIVECENSKSNSFVIGKIEKVKSKSVFIRYFDATGVYESELTKIKYQKITVITFNDRYSAIFSKYLKNKK